MPRGVYIRTNETKKALSEARLLRKEKYGFINSPKSRIRMSQNSAKYWLGKNITEEHKQKISGENSGQWLGDNVSYLGLHKRVYRAKGKASKCELKDETCKGNFEWANISHDYNKDINDFMELCQSHHKRYDNKNIRLRTVNG